MRRDAVITVYCDGSSGQDGSGGYAATLTAPGARRATVYGGVPSGATNQRMELMAAIVGLRALRRPGFTVKVFSDSAYVVNCFREGWIENWRRKDWRHKGGERPNRAYWETLESHVALHRVEFIHVRGHSGIARNEEVDRIAVAARAEAVVLGESFNRKIKEGSDAGWEYNGRTSHTRPRSRSANVSALRSGRMTRQRSRTLNSR